MNFLQKISLKLRLTLLFGLIFTGMLSGFCYILYSQFSKLQIAEFDTKLYNYAIDIAESLDVDKYGDVEFDSNILKLNEKILPFTLKNSFISVMDIYGHVIETRPMLKETQIAHLGEGILSKVLRSGASFSTMYYETVPHRIINYLLPVLHKDTPLILQISVPETDFLLINRNLVKFFYISVPAMLLLSLMIGYFFVGRALRPMMEIIAKTKIIEVSNLEERVPVPESKDEIWQLADTINHLLSRLHETFNAQERFIQDASHQLKTPLTIMKGELEVFKSEEKSEEEIAHFLDSMAQEINFLTQLTNNLLILARVDSGIENLSFTENRLDEVVISQISRLSKFANMKKISLQINFDSFYQASETDLSVMSDRDLLGVVFYNLIENAIKYSPAGSTVKIAGHNLPQTLQVTIEDEGEGIEAKDIEKIFERFYRMQKNATQASGSGLGLAICKLVADSLHARIWAENIESGTRFYFEIPKQLSNKST
ncbi:MAG: HAMP domain-containing histidine kinase [Bacteriovorax sp.]|nr:HAMP domain-containing histidine kinase [Bacteriovorax sp.]